MPSPLCMPINLNWPGSVAWHDEMKYIIIIKSGVIVCFATLLCNRFVLDMLFVAFRPPAILPHRINMNSIVFIFSLDSTQVINQYWQCTVCFVESFSNVGRSRTMIFLLIPKATGCNKRRNNHKCLSLLKKEPLWYNTLILYSNEFGYLYMRVSFLSANSVGMIILHESTSYISLPGAVR